MVKPLTIALAQINVTVGDIRGNSAKIVDATHKAASQGADLVLFPEMAITGYPPEDLVFKGVFQRKAKEAVQQIAEETQDSGTAVLVGGLWEEGGKLYNSVFLIDGGKVLHIQHKRSLPNYGVFDEKRLFTKGAEPDVVTWRGVKLGILICEDVWDARWPQRLAGQAAELLLVINASPFETGKAAARREVVRHVARDCALPVIYLNMVAGQDELVFDGGSFVMDAGGQEVGQLAAFEEELALTTWGRVIPAHAGIHLAAAEADKMDPGICLGDKASWHCTAAPIAAQPDDLASIYGAMVLGLRDYVTKNKFKGVVIGLSGGIDSGLTAAVAVDALGAEMVHGLLMPSPYTSDDSIEDADELASNLGISMDTIAIEPAMQAFDAMLKPVFAGREADTTEENIQARIRGNLLMAVSNKMGYMVLTTGNKSEMSVGYATLYGDMCGGYSVLKDVYKTTVWALSRWRNEPGTIIPERMITKAPTAELRPNQTDQDSLPPYDVLDAILHGLIEERLSMAEVVARGHEKATVERVARMIYIAEYKRRQAPPGVKITGMAFGRDRRYPITNQWIWQRG